MLLDVETQRLKLYCNMINTSFPRHTHIKLNSKINIIKYHSIYSQCRLGDFFVLYYCNQLFMKLQLVDIIDSWGLGALEPPQVLNFVCTKGESCSRILGKRYEKRSRKGF